jgi:hypothetical protein
MTYHEHRDRNIIASLNYYWVHLNALHDDQQRHKERAVTFPLSNFRKAFINIQDVPGTNNADVEIRLGSCIFFSDDNVIFPTPAITVTKGAHWEDDKHRGRIWAKHSPHQAHYEIDNALVANACAHRITAIHTYTDKFSLWECIDAFCIVQDGALFETILQNACENYHMGIDDFVQRYYYNIRLALKSIYGI